MSEDLIWHHIRNLSEDYIQNEEDSVHFFLGYLGRKRWRLKFKEKQVPESWIIEQPGFDKAARSSIEAIFNMKEEEREREFFEYLRRSDYRDFDFSNGRMTRSLEAFKETMWGKHLSILVERLADRDDVFFRRLSDHIRRGGELEQQDQQHKVKMDVICGWPWSFWLMTESAASDFHRCITKQPETLSPGNFRQIKRRNKLKSSPKPPVTEVVLSSKNEPLRFETIEGITVPLVRM